MIRTLTVFGTRPEAIKMAPLIKIFNSNPEFKNIICVTAQHRQMLDQVLSLFEITPDIDLNIMREDQDLFELTSNILISIRDILRKLHPDLVIVQGDTTTAFTCALGAFYEGIPVAHVEAGLRTGNLKAPFPEEANRVLIGKLATLHFCPTPQNAENLRKEGIVTPYIWVTGNTVIDSLFWVIEKIKPSTDKMWKKISLITGNNIKPGTPIILITAHRRENFGKDFKNICYSLKELAIRHKNWHFIYPVHLNPNVLNPVKDILSNIPNIHLIEPLDYALFVFLMNECKIILTDSGGIQEEAPSLGKPVLIMRKVTERQEAIEAGTVLLVGTEPRTIITTVEMVMEDETLYNKIAQRINPYGDGKAALRIANAILEWWKDKKGSR